MTSDVHFSGPMEISPMKAQKRKEKGIKSLRECINNVTTCRQERRRETIQANLSGPG